MPSLSELHVEHKSALTDELVSRVHPIGGILPDEVLLRDLVTLGPLSSKYDREHLEVFQENPPPVWKTLISGLDSRERSQVNRSLKVLIRARVETLGELRERSMEELLELQGMGILSLTFLKQVFQPEDDHYYKEEIGFPFFCPECGSNLGQRGSVEAWALYGGQQYVGHIDPGEEDGVVYSIDLTDKEPDVKIWCAECSAELPSVVEDIVLDPDYETRESDDGID